MKSNYQQCSQVLFKYQKANLSLRILNISSNVTDDTHSNRMEATTPISKSFPLCTINANKITTFFPT